MANFSCQAGGPGEHRALVFQQYCGFCWVLQVVGWEELPCHQVTIETGQCSQDNYLHLPVFSFSVLLFCFTLMTRMTYYTNAHTHTTDSDFYTSPK